MVSVSRVKVIYLKAVICTSLIWLLIDVFVIEYFTDCKYKEEQIATDIQYKYSSREYIPTEMLKPFSSEELASHSITPDSFDQESIVQRNALKLEERKTLKADERKTLKVEVIKKPDPNDPGEGGKAVFIPKEQETEMKKLFDIHMFNVMASDKISLDRSLVDVRPPTCKNKEKTYPRVDKLPTTSIVIVFHNEAWSTLLRTVHSAINRSPSELLLEIILVDDASTLEHLGEQLDHHVSQLSVPIHIVRMKTRTGAIEGRIKGANIAEADTLTFLDSHCECTEGWLEPLLYEVYKDSTSVASPVIDVINLNTFEYLKSSPVFGAFDWDLRFSWLPLPEREIIRTGGDQTAPIRSPTIAGGLFTINKKFFYKIGAFDKGMDTWGAENLDISWRTWMCHGTLLIAPCSRVGHVFRKKRYFTFPKGVRFSMNKNNARLAEVWMDEWKFYYYQMRPDAKGMDYGNITDRLKIKHDVKCKSFKWYLDNIYPEMIMPLEYEFLGRVQNNITKQCIHGSNDKYVGIRQCTKLDHYQIFCFTKEHRLVYNSKCLEYNISDRTLSLQACIKGAESQKWTYNKKTLQIEHIQSKLCLDSDGKNTENEKPRMSPCNSKITTQKWLLVDT